MQNQKKHFKDYEENCKGYGIYIPEEKRIVISRDLFI